MPHTTYRVKMSDGFKFRFSANLSEASAPLYLFDDDGERVSTQYQTADARHRAEDAAELMYEALSEGDGPRDDDGGPAVESVKALTDT